LHRIHIPLQSGSNEFETDEASLPTRIYGTVNKIREVMPHACIGVDVIVGFPEKQMNIF
jgi:threonylcarbamoyladenosine tRNA methylthiotransferase MtaB